MQTLLKWHKLGLEDFPGTLEEQRKAAFEAADQYSKMQRSLAPMISEKHPDIIMPNDTCSLFWYVMHEGTSSIWSNQHSQEYDMSTKLNDKDIKSITDGGMKDEDMKLLAPQMFDMDNVKKDLGKIEDVEKVKKDTEHSYLINHAIQRKSQSQRQSFRGKRRHHVKNKILPRQISETKFCQTAA